MRLVRIVCEGQTEETFVRDVLAPAFYGFGLNLIPQMIETSAGHRGGALAYQRVRKHLRNTLRQTSQPFVTTMFDLYRLDKSFPGFAEAKSKSLGERLKILKTALHQDIIEQVNCAPSRFIPHIQPYEFEALLFSDVPTLVSVESGWARAESQLLAVRNSVETPEHINDGPDTKPTARLATHLNQPHYSKTLHGPTAAERIGLSKIEAECRFFAGWLQQLRDIATP